MRWLAPFVVLLAACGTDRPLPAPPDASVPEDAPVAADAGPPEVEWGPCPSGFQTECATLAMPIDHADPGGETIDVFVSRRPGGSRQLWLLQGGPGGSAESFEGLLGFLLMVDPELEIMTIEHRGVGESTRLGCAAEGAGTPGGGAITVDEWPACRDELVAEWGERLAYFSTTQAAHDLALAIDRTRRVDQEVFVYGVSYGTYWANRYAVLHPEQPAGIVLDAPVQPGSTLERYDLEFEPVGRRVFSELCPAAPACAEHLGDDPVAVLDRVSAALATGHCAEVGVDLATWKIVFAIALMDSTLRNWLPALIHRLDRCNEADRVAIDTLMGNLFGGGGGGGAGVPRMSRALQLHVVLSEHWPREHVDSAEVDAAAETSLFFQAANADAYAMQGDWPRYAVDPLRDTYAPTSLPVLTMAGAYDPASPPERFGVGFRDHLTGAHQTYVEMPYGAHGVLTTSPVGGGMPHCPVQLVRAFLADPQSELPVDCVDDVLAPTFDSPAGLLMAYWGTTDLYGAP